MSEGTSEMSDIDLFALWEYDSFPYLLGARVTKMRDDGAVYAPSYSSWFAPKHLLTPERGQRVWDDLQDLRGQHRAEMDRINEDFKRRAQEVLGSLAK